MILRTHQPADFDDVVALWHASKREVFSYVPVQQTYTIKDDAWYLREFILKDCQVWLAEEGEWLLGFMAPKDNLVNQLFVRVGNQRAGVGTRLLE